MFDGLSSSFAALFGIGGLILVGLFLVHQFAILIVLLIPPHGWLATSRALVVRRWQANERPLDSQGSHVIIEGRASGLLSWMTTLLRIDPTTRLKVSTERVHLAVSSLSGKDHLLLPLENICYTYYGHHKPWKKALLVYFVGWHILPGAGAFVLSALAFALTADGTLQIVSKVLGGLFGFSLSCILAVVYYVRHKAVMVGIKMGSGKTCELRFRRSLIENRDVRVDEVAYVAELLDYLCDNRRNHR